MEFLIVGFLLGVLVGFWVTTVISLHDKVGSSVKPKKPIHPPRSWSHRGGMEKKGGVREKPDPSELRHSRRPKGQG